MLLSRVHQWLFQFLVVRFFVSESCLVFLKWRLEASAVQQGAFDPLVLSCHTECFEDIPKHYIVLYFSNKRLCNLFVSYCDGRWCPIFVSEIALIMVYKIVRFQMLIGSGINNSLHIFPGISNSQIDLRFSTLSGGLLSLCFRDTRASVMTSVISSRIDLPFFQPSRMGE